jgi:hypothetical protein
MRSPKDAYDATHNGHRIFKSYVYDLNVPFVGELAVQYQKDSILLPCFYSADEVMEPPIKKV